MPGTLEADRVEAVRAFNRFYTRWVGALDEGLLRTRHSLPEARVLFELGRARSREVSDLRRTLDVDPGYLSRLLGRLEEEGLLTRERSAADGRRQLARLTRTGRSEFRVLDGRSAAEVAETLGALRDEERNRLVSAMETIHTVLDPPDGAPAAVLRAPGPGDYGWIVHRHGVLYAEEYGWNEEFEALVAEIVARFVQRLDPRRERCWIAERQGQNVGCVFLVRKSERVAQLRCLLVEPSARGHGIGQRLVEECVRFARQHGYRKMILWTNDVLHAARRIYEPCGFQLVEEDKHHSFGHDLVGQTWELKL